VLGGLLGVLTVMLLSDEDERRKSCTFPKASSKRAHDSVHSRRRRAVSLRLPRVCV